MPSGETGDDREARLAQRLGELPGIAFALRGGVAAADHGERRGAQQLEPAMHVEERRRIAVSEALADRPRRQA